MCVFWGIKSADRLWLWFLVGAVESSDLSWLIDRFFNFYSQFIIIINFILLVRLLFLVAGVFAGWLCVG